MINLTKNMTLQSKWKKIYLISRFLLYFFFFLAGSFVAYQILFPEISLIYSFSNTNSLKNTLVSMKTGSQNPSKNGSVNKGEILTFNANPLGNFKDSKLNLTLNKNSKKPTDATVNIRKSYSAFFYPEGSPLGWANGSLLSVNGNYYIISNGKARKFVSGLALDQLGFSRSSFKRISQEDLRINPTGEDILKSTNYPDDTLIVVDNQYYQFEGGQLIPFLNEKAFLSRYDSTLAIPKNNDFLKDKSVSENFIGFADGTLASSDQSVFILSRGNSYPIADSETFIAMGFDWSDVLPLTPAEINSYKRQKQFTVNQPHPDGTLFFDKNEDKYFIIDNGQRHPIEIRLAVETYAKVSPIVVDSRSLGKNVSCKLKKVPLTFHTFSCQFDLSEINDLIGNDYQFDVDFGSDVKLQTAEVTLYTKFNQSNLMTSLSLIKNRIIGNLQQ